MRTAIAVTDMARDRREESALLMNDPMVDAIVYVGGAGTHWTVPVAERVVSDGGHAAEVLARSQEFNAINVPGAANQQGASRIRSFVY